MVDLILTSVAANALLYGLTWAIGTRLRNISIIDGIWSLSFALTLVVCLYKNADVDAHRACIAILIFVWAIRLSVHLLPRSLRHGEDHRYTRMRTGWSSWGFLWWSLFAIFGLQLMLSIVLSLPFMVAFSTTGTPQPIFHFGTLIALFGLVYEIVADEQLKRFRAHSANDGSVLNQGLWRYSRHPNYFGEWLFWCGIWVACIAAGAPLWTVHAPILLTILLLRVSGVANMESTIQDRRPAYAQYIRQTNAFFPGVPRDSR